MTFALTADGLLTNTQSEEFDDLAASIQAQFGTNTNTDISSIMGQWLNITAENSAWNQSQLLAVWRRFDPNSAIGVGLNALAALTGSIRRGATKSIVNGFVSFSAGGTPVTAGSLIRNEGNATTWAAVGTYSDTGGPYPELVPAVFEAVDTGPTLANANTVWSVVTVIPNFTGFTNPTDDATIGQDEESDESFRRRRQFEIYSQNIGPLLSIKGAVSKVDTANGTVTDVRVYHNPAINPADGDGIPFKAFNVVVETNPPLPVPQVGANLLADDIALAIFSATGAGGEAYGTDYGVAFPITVLDVEGQSQGPTKFDVVANIDIYIDIEISLFDNLDDGPIVPSDPQQMADLIRSETATTLTGAFVTLGRDARSLDTQGVIQSLILDGQLSGISSAIAGVSITAPAASLAVTVVALAAGTGSDFTVPLGHGLTVGDRVIHSGFSNPLYNGAFTVTAIVSGLVYEVAAITFTGTDIGTSEEVIGDTTASISIRQKPDYDTGNIRIFVSGAEY